MKGGGILKYYAVKIGRIPGIYTSWDECKKQVSGFSNAKYKSFESKEEADQYISENSDIMFKTEIEAYVDGSYSETLKKYAYGCVIIKDGQVIHKMSGNSANADFIEMRNVAGELQAAVQAVRWAINNKIKSIRIYHDYQGIASWANGEWKANKRGTQEYASFINNCSSNIHIEFTKVKGHSGLKYNEMADNLARMGLQQEEIEDGIIQYNEFCKTYKYRESKVSFFIQDKLITEKSIIDFAKFLLKKRGYKKISNINVEYQVEEGLLKITFDSADVIKQKIHIRIFD